MKTSQRKPMKGMVCSIDGCERAVKGRGWCSAHYNAWRASREDLPRCVVGECPQAGGAARGMCSMHYQRFVKDGDPGGAERIIGRNKGKTCSGPECDRPAHAKGMCSSHRKQASKGHPLTPLRSMETYGMTTVERLQHYTSPAGEGGCREWLGGSFCRGYPYLGEKFMGTKFPHRMVYMLNLGEKIPSYVPVHHKCSNRKCVEPSHLQAVTPVENNAEMMERNHYINRIAALEDALADTDPNHPLLEAAR